MTLAFPDASIRQLAARLRGCLILPGDGGYDTARRVANRAIDRRPALIVRCAGTEDVLRAIEFAQNHDLLVAVRGGGHSFAGKSVCDGGLVIDLSTMKGIQVDPGRRTAVAEAGLTLGDFDEATQAHGLVTTLGTVPQTGIAGLTLGGGLGWLMSRHGLACDNLLSARVVTADGRFLMASADENEDLFWGLRGGGGNFGVVTSFEYRLHPLTHVLGGTLTYPKDDVRRVLRFVREYNEGAATDDLFIIAGVAPVGGEPMCCVFVCYCGDPEAGERTLKPLRSFGPPLADTIRRIPYLDVQNLLFDRIFGHRVSTAELDAMQISFYAKTGFIREYSDGLIDAMAGGMAKASSSPWFSWVAHFHGAACRVPLGETAFGRREAGYYLENVVFWQDPAHSETAISWLRGYWRCVLPFLSGDVYVNHLAYDDEERVRAAYGPNYDRLVALKDKFDPTNFFRMNHNVRPSA